MGKSDCLGVDLRASTTLTRAEMKPILMDKMEKSEEAKVQLRVIPTTSPVKYVAYIVFGLMFGLLVALVLLSVLTYGNTKDIKMENDILKTNWYQHLSATNRGFGGVYQQQHKLEKDLTFHIVKTGEIIKENIVLTGQEEIITTPQAMVIYDFSKGWVIAKLSTVVRDACFVSQFDMTEDIDRVRETLLNDKSDVYVTADETRIQYESTGRTVSRALLSPSAEKMCENSCLVWCTEVTKKKEHEIEKRISGQYCVLLPDSRPQILTYTADCS